MLNELFKSRCQRATRGIAPPAQCLELPNAQIDIANDHESPSITDDGKGLCNLTVQYQAWVDCRLCFVVHFFVSLIMKVTPCKLE